MCLKTEVFTAIRMRMNPVNMQWYTTVIQKFYKFTKDITVFYICLAPFFSQTEDSMHIGEEQEEKQAYCYKEGRRSTKFVLIFKWL